MQELYTQHYVGVNILAKEDKLFVNIKRLIINNLVSLFYVIKHVK